VDVEGGVQVIFHVREGPTVRVCHVRFVGNENVDSDTLKCFMRTQTTVLYFIRSGYFDPRTLEDDTYNIQRYYWGEGYLDVRATVESIRFNDERSRASVTFRVVEGPRYTVRNIGVS